MTKTNKLKLGLIIWAAIVAIGIAVIAIFGFNYSATVSNYKALTVKFDNYATIGEDNDLLDEFEKVCKDQMKGVNYIDDEIRISANDGTITFKCAYNTEDSKLVAVGDGIKAAIKSNAKLNPMQDSVDYTINTVEVQPAYTYIWRAALSAAAVALIAGVYVTVRYSVAMGITTLVTCVADVLVMVCMTAILRIPVTTSLAVSGVIAVLYSALVSMVQYGTMRKLFKTEDHKAMEIAASVRAASEQSRKNIVILNGTTLVVSVLLAIFGGAAIRAVFLNLIFAVIATSFSALFVVPSFVTMLREKGEIMKMERAEKQRIAKLEAQD